MAMLEIRDLEVYYGVIQAIKGISFDVNEGEVIATVETDKITNNLESPASGILRISVEAGEELPVAGKMGYIEIEDD